MTARFRLLAAATVAAVLAGCASEPTHRAVAPMPGPSARGTQPKLGSLPALPSAGSGRGGYYQDDGPGDNPPPGLWDVPDAEVKDEPLLPRANRPYVVFGQTYVPITDNSAFSQRGVGSWYGKKFHGQKTSSGELYDMYKMTAAHPTLPIPSYARVTSIVTGRSVVVRINDRGPFHADRVIDLSYTAALKLGLLGAGSHEVEVERLIPGQNNLWANRRVAPSLTIADTRSADGAGKAPNDAVAPEISALMLEDRALPGEAPLSIANATPTVKVSAKLPAEPAKETAQPAGAAPFFYLQLGAFSRADRANEVMARLQKYGGVLAQLEVVQAGSIYRLFCGPFVTRRDASAAEEALPVSLGLRPIIVKR